MIALYSVIGFLGCLCVFWGIAGTRYFLSAFNLTGVAEILPSDMSYILFAVVLPIILVLMIIVVLFIAVSYNENRKMIVGILNNSNNKISQLNVIGKYLLEMQQTSRNVQFFTNLPVIFNEMSQMLADIIKKASIASEVVLLDALSKSGDSKLYSVCKIILDARESIPNFDEKFRRIVKRDESVAGLISIFVEKYDQLLTIMRKYDTDGFVVFLFEEGSLGRIINVLNNALVGKNESEKQEMKEPEEESLNI